ncbi:hypothetical protein Q8F55_004748 [Vanrija albida]|uniref:galacturonan 1,4-alpha-galacturonidase n=1 Tax=Vanrija albida TaxID=181172 RepID=A0ABR3PZQ0_9TREE
MRALALLTLAGSSAALVLPAQEVLLAALDWARPALPGFCTVTSNGHDDTDALAGISKRCGRNGIISLPSKEYILTKPVTLTLSNGYLSLSGWINYTAPLGPGDVALTLAGSKLAVTSKGGGVRVVSDEAAGYALAVRASNSALTGFGVESSGPGILIADTANVDVSDAAVAASTGVTVARAHDVALTRLAYTGVGECVAVRGGTHDVAVADSECRGAGVTIGPEAGEDEQVIRHVALGGVRVLPLDGVPPAIGVRFDAARDAHGQAANISIGGLRVEDVGVAIGLDSEAGSFSFHHVNVTDVSGTAGGTRVVELHCPAAAPCHHWRFKRVQVEAEAARDNYVCDNVPGVHVHRGAWECLPSA